MELKITRHNQTKMNQGSGQKQELLRFETLHGENML